MKKGLATSLYRDLDEEGVEVSGGEAQKIALARALYKDAPIVVLDTYWFFMKENLCSVEIMRNY